MDFLIVSDDYIDNKCIKLISIENTYINCLNVLIIEDSEYCADLNLRELKRGGFSVYAQRVETAEDMIKAVLERKWDIILSDNFMPIFNAVQALDIRNRLCRDTFFIILSEYIDSESIDYAISQGCNGFVHKKDIDKLASKVKAVIGRT